MLARYKNPDGTQVETRIERKVREYLEACHFPFAQEHTIIHTQKGQKKELYRRYDFLVSDGDGGGSYKFLIECDGDWFHAKKYVEGVIPKSKLTYTQKKNVLNDSKKTRIAKELGIPLLRFWEEDILKNFQKVKTSIKNEIKRQTSN